MSEYKCGVCLDSGFIGFGGSFGGAYQTRPCNNCRIK